MKLSQNSQQSIISRICHFSSTLLGGFLLGLVAVAGLIGAIGSGWFDYLVFNQQFVKVAESSAWAGLLVLAVVIGYQYLKLYLVYHCRSFLAVNRDKHSRWDGAFLVAFALFLSAVSFSASVTCAFYNFYNPKYDEEVARRKAEVVVQTNAESGTTEKEYDRQLGMVTKDLDAEIDYWKGLRKQQQSIQRSDGTWIGPRAQEIMLQTEKVEAEREKKVEKLQVERAGAVKAIRDTGFQKQQQLEHEVATSNSAHSPIARALLSTIFSTPDYPLWGYKLFIAVQGVAFALIMEGSTWTAAIVLGGHHRRRLDAAREEDELERELDLHQKVREHQARSQQEKIESELRELIRSRPRTQDPPRNRSENDTNFHGGDKHSRPV